MHRDIHIDISDEDNKIQKYTHVIRNSLELIYNKIRIQKVFMDCPK